MNTHGLTIPCGKFAGELYTRLTVSYLRWMVSSRHQYAATAQAELDRRGTLNPTLDVSGHAVDRASCSYALEIWKATRLPDEGLHSWLHRIAGIALLHVEPRREGVYVWGPLELVFETSLVWPVLKTVVYNPRLAGVPRASTSPDHPRHRLEATP